jgi:Cys-tRNA(Pro)/Cys-tRNA(Cys) deacylase
MGVPVSRVTRGTKMLDGGISPFGQLRTLPTVIETQALALDRVYINGGQRGLQVRLKPSDAASLSNFVSAPVIA